MSTLAHEIIENFEAQTVAKDDWRHAHSTVHPTAVAAGDKILEQLQRSAGGALSGGRLNSYIAVVKTAGKGEKNLRVEAYQNDFIVYEIVTSAKGEKLIVTRVASKTLDASRVAGFTAKTTALPPASAAGVRKAAALLAGDPTATAVLGATATKADAPKAADWNEMVRLAIVAQMPSDVILRSSDRFREEPVASARSTRSPSPCGGRIAPERAGYSAQATRPTSNGLARSGCTGMAHADTP